MFRLSCIIVLSFLIYSTAHSQVESLKFPVPELPFSPKQYVCQFSEHPILIDGKIDEPTWNLVPWTDPFVDIEGNVKSTPLYSTQVKMLWDSSYLYVAAKIQEPHLWATIRQHDEVIFHDNDFEVFIDPNGDTQPYYESEFNALGTVWDLLLRLPYRDAEKVAVNAWDIKGLKVGVALQGTLNDLSDVDSGWTIEIAYPWSVLGECALGAAPPKNGDQWRINFSRVEWRTHTLNGKYVKDRSPITGQPLPEYNWVWSPQGLINMHYPEMWGFIQFSTSSAGTAPPPFILNPVDIAKWNLRLVYYAERQYQLNTGKFSANVDSLDYHPIPAKDYPFLPSIAITPNLFEAQIESADHQTVVHIRQDGLTWITHPR